MDHESQDANRCNESKLTWSEETKEVIESLMARFQLKERQLSDREQQLDNERSRLRKLQNEMLEEKEKSLEELAGLKEELKSSFEEKLNALEEEKRFMKDVSNSQASKVKLDVGGHIFSTSLSTLCKHDNSMLAAMFSGRHQLKECEDGTFFIDRDGTYFRYILNFLRGRIIDASDLPSDRHVLREIKQEADFYQLNDLAVFIDNLLANDALGKNDFSQEDINKLLSTVVRTEKSSKPSISNSRLLSQGISVANAAFMGQHQNVNENGNVGGKADFVIQNMTKNKLDFTGKSLSGISFSHTTFNHDVSFRNADLSGSLFYGCEFSVGCTIDFTHADLRDCDFRNCKGKEAGPRMSFGPSTFDFGSGGLVTGASSETFIRLIQSKKIIFRGAKLDGTKFDPNVFSAVVNCSV